METYQCDDADYIAVAMGSMANQIKDVVDQLRQQGQKVGLLALHLYRPFPADKLLPILENAKGIIVFEKGLSYGVHGAVYGDIKAALYPAANRPFIRNYILGLSYNRDVEVCGLYCAEWVSLVLSCYSITPMGVIFHDWPDGQPLIEQEGTVIRVFAIVLDEILKERSHGK